VERNGATHFLKGLAGVGPVEGMRHGRVLVSDELSDLGLKFGHRGKVAAAQTFSLEDAEEILIDMSRVYDALS
jgi:hypothetical protein